MSKEVLDVEEERRRGREAKALATTRDHQIRINSVARDLQLGLPTSIPQPDGEEFPRKCHMQLRSQDQRSEIVKGFIQGPPNKTIYNSSPLGPSFGVTSKSNSCSCLLGPGDGKGSSGQLNSWNFLKSSSSSGGGGAKSPPPHVRSAKCHVHSRTSPKAPSLTSKQSVKGTSSSPVSLTTVTPPPLQPQSHKPTFTEKLSSMFSDKGGPGGGPSSSTSSPGMFARLLSDETKSKSKSSKVKGPSGAWSGIKRIPPSLPFLPPTETQVYVLIPGEVGGGRNSNGASGGSLSSRTLSPPPGSQGLIEGGGSDGSERERAYSDTMLRSGPSPFLCSSDMSESRMSLCYEGEESRTVKEGGLLTEPDGPPSPLGNNDRIQPNPSSFLYQQIHHHGNEDQESKYASSMNVSTTPPPGTDFT